MQDNVNLDVLRYLRLLWKSRVLVILTTLVISAGSVVVAFVLPPVYTSKATLLPASSGSGGSAAGLSDLASLAGLSIPGAGGGTDVTKIMAVLDSRGLKETVLLKNDLVGFFVPNAGPKVDRLRVAVDSLEKGIVSVTQDKDGLISIEANTSDPKVSKLLVDELLAGLEESLNEMNLGSQQKSITNLERQVEAQNDKILRLQKDMIDFQLKNGLIDATRQTQETFDLLSALMQRKLQLELDYSSLQSQLSPQNPKLTLAKEQMAALDAQIAKAKSGLDTDSIGLNAAPRVMADYQNKVRDLEIAQKIFVGLTSSLETQNYNLSPDAVYVDIIDRAKVADIPSKPSKSLIVLIGMTGGFLFSIFLVYGWRLFLRLRRGFIAPESSGTPE